jgi:hypothetical protein
MPQSEMPLEKTPLGQTSIYKMPISEMSFNKQA